MSEHKPAAGAHDPAADETVRLGPGGAIKLSRSGVGITLQSSTLVVLLGLGWEAKGALEQQLDSIESARVEFEHRTDTLEHAIGELELKVAAAQIGAEQLLQLQVSNASLRGELAAALQRLDSLERDLDRLDTRRSR